LWILDLIELPQEPTPDRWGKRDYLRNDKVCVEFDAIHLLIRPSYLTPLLIEGLEAIADVH
jgi:hypothetical protein